jgi:hypothetical protein
MFMKHVLLFATLATLLTGCSGGSSDLSASDNAAAQNNFSRPLTDAEKAKMGNAKGAPAGANPADKKPIGG